MFVILNVEFANQGEAKTDYSAIGKAIAKRMLRLREIDILA